MSEIKNQRENSQKQSSQSKTLQETDFTLPTGALEKTLSAFPPERANELNSIIEVLREKRPEFIHAFETNADKSLEQYILDTLTTATIPSPRLQGALASAISRHTPDIDSASLVRELQKGVLIDTSGHCGLLGDTESIHSLLLLAIAARQRGDSHIFAFAGGGVPLSNATFPGGFFWNGQRVSLHPKKISGQSSGSMTAATVEACVLKTILQTSPKYKGTSDEHGFPSTLEAVPHERQDFAAFLREELSSPNSQLRDLFTNHDLRFCDQVARINETLWSQLNTTHQGLPKLAYGLVEDVNRDVLQQLLVKESGVRPEDSQEPVYRLLFDPNLRNQVLDAFNPPDSSAPVVQGAWMHDETGAVSYGTHLFWLLEGVPHLDPFTGKQSVKNARQSRLSISSDGTISNENGSFRVELTPENLRDLLDGVIVDEERAIKLSPGTFLNIVILALENGSIIGGMNQADYASTYQRILGPILADAVPCAAVENFRRLTLDHFCLGLLFTNIEGKEGSFEHLIRQPEALVAEVNRNARTMTVGEAGILDISNWINTIVPKAEFSEKLAGKVIEVTSDNGKTALKLAPRFSFSSLYQEMKSVTSSKSP